MGLAAIIVPAVGVSRGLGRRPEGLYTKVRLMAKIPREAFNQVQAALERYEVEVGAAPLTSATKRTYLLHATNFVRWLADDFVPGERLGEAPGGRGQ